MGLSNDSAGNRTFLKISDGKVAKRCDQSTPNAVEQTKSDGSKFYELHYSSVSGMIRDVKKRVHNFGTDLCITIEDKGDVFELQMPWSSRYSSGFFNRMPNIDVSKPVKFTPWMKVEDGKKKTALYLRQDDEDIDFFWTKANPGGCPPMVQITVKGQKVWDDTERQEFYEKYLVDVFVPKLNGVTVEETSTPDDDLPF